MNTHDHEGHAELTAVDYDPFDTGALTRVVPSTEPQREIWLAAKLSVEASLAYNESVGLGLHGALDRDALQAALQDLVIRHDALRATFGPDGETFCVLDALALDMPQTDLSALAVEKRQAALDARLRHAVETPFDLECGPLFCAELVTCSGDYHVLILAAHHIVCDGWSWWVIVRELAVLYAGHMGVAHVALPMVDSFADFALAQAASVDRHARAADEAYWLTCYADSVPVLDLPTDHPRPARRTFASQREDYVLDAELMAAVKRTSGQRGASVFAALLGSFAAVLARISGQTDVVIGIPAAAQAIDGHDHLVGHGVNLLPLRFAPDSAAPFTRLLDVSATTLLDALEHQQYTFGSLLKKLDVERDPSRLPLVSVLFNIDQALDQEAAALPGLELTFSSAARSFENFELSINAVQEHGQLRLECQYNRDLFDAATVRRWLGAYETLLRAAVAQPQTALGALPLVSATGRAELQALQPAATPFDSEQRAHEAFEAQCDRAPERVAVRAGAVELTYAELEARANRIAHCLRARGVHRGALVGIALDRDVDMLAAVLGVLKSGAGYVPLDPGFPAERLTYMVGDAGLAALLTHSEHAPRFDLRGRPVLALDQFAAELAAAPATRLGRDAGSATPDSIAYVIYTSGSTGQPKGVLVPHRATANFLAAMRLAPGLAPDDRLVAVTTLSFDIAFMELLLPLAVGAQVVVASRDQARDGAALRALIETSEANVLQATPAGWRLLLDSGWQGHSGFKAVSGGEPLSLSLAEALLARCDEVWNGYGPTEATVYATFWKVQDPRDGIVIGRPVANTTVWILDGRHQLCPLGVPGELWIGGPSVASGYRNRPELTAERFVADPYSDEPGARLYRTGDRGRWLANGTIEHLGRVDFQIKLRGYRIEPGEIEAHLLARPEVAQAVVIVREDHPGDVRLVAYLVAAPAVAVDESTLRARLRELLPDYMVPQHFMVLDAVPLLPNGKLDRARLPSPLATIDVALPSVAPHDELERQVATAMAAVLGSVTLGVDDNFFEHGGHSLLAAQLIARLNRDLNLKLSLRTVFDAPTVSRLAAVIRGVGVSAAAVPSRLIPRLADRETAPLSLMQQRLWYVEQLHPGRVVYNTPSAHRLCGLLNVEAFERALVEMVRRQPVLRTSIEVGETSPRQRIHPELAVALLPVEDLTQLPADEREAHLLQRLQSLIDKPFDLTVAPLFRARLFRLGEQEHVFFFMTHHIIWDGWSFDLMYEEMSALYAAYCAGQVSTLAPLAVEYADFSAWQREWMSGDELAAQLAHWLQRLANPPEPLELPADRARPALMSGRGGIEWIRLPRASVDAMHALAQRVGVTSFMVLLTTYYILLHRLSGQRDLVVSTPVRGRDSVDLEPVMGFFVNALPLRLAIDPQSSFLDTLHSVRDVVLDAFGYADVPFQHLVIALKLPRDESRPPLSQAMFSFQDVRQRQQTWGDLRHENLPVFQHGAGDDLGLWFIEEQRGVVGGFNYNTDIFDAATAIRFQQSFETLLDAALTDPQQSVARMPLVPDVQRALLRHWNDNAAEFPDGCVHALIETQCQRTPQRVAVRCGEHTVSYAELDARANRMAHLLRAHGVRGAALVGIALGRSIDMLVTLLGALKSGAGYVPLDPAYPVERLQHVVADAGLAVLITQSEFAARFVMAECPLLLFEELDAELGAAPTTRLAPDVDAATPDSVAYVIYTSGSTGQPKGVEIPHRAVVNFLFSMARRPGLREDDRLLAVTTLSFDIAVLELLGPLTVGAEVVLVQREQALDGEALATMLTSQRITLMQATPATWRLLLQAGWSGSPGFRALCGGEALAPDLATQLLARCDEVWNLYGPTETTVWSTCAKVEAAQQGISIGTPIANTTVWILDEQRQLCPIGVTGELWIGGAGLALGYRHQPALTAERFVPDPYAQQPAARMYRTGDRGRWLANGTLEHQGRLDFQVKLRGHRIELGGIEAVARMEPALQDCVVVIHEISAIDRRLVLYAVANEAESTLLPRLRALLVAHLPAYMQPQHLVVLPALPQTPNGKIDRKALPAPVPLPAADGGKPPVAVPAITDPRQRYLGAVWCELVGVEQVLPRDNFFDIGGHSLLAVELAARVRRETGARLNLLDIATGTLASLATELPDIRETGAAKVASLGARLRRLLGFR